MKKERDQVEVWIDADFLGKNTRVGTLSHDRNQFFFEYDRDWLTHKDRFAIDPDLGLFANEQTTSRVYGIFTDSAPDRWGRILMKRREAIFAKHQNRKARQLHEWDYLMGVQDLTRMGALRFCRHGQFIDNNPLSAPPVTSLADLQARAHAIDEDRDTSDRELETWLTMLIAPGSSLGGARPKANFRENDGSLWIAKFPKLDDLHDVGLWEAVTLELAAGNGIETPPYKTRRLNSDHHTLCIKRFDREGSIRKMFVSAMTLLGKSDGEEASYLDIAEFIQNNGCPEINNQLENLWRRMVFNVLVSNRDDHLRNHGFIRNDQGWFLSPAYDLNPNTEKLTHALNLNFNSNEPTIDTLFDHDSIAFLRLSWDRASEIAKEIHHNLQNWRIVAKRMGISDRAISDMEPAFELVDAKLTIPEKSPPKSRRSNRR